MMHEIFLYTYLYLSPLAMFTIIFRLVENRIDLRNKHARVGYMEKRVYNYARVASECTKTFAGNCPNEDHEESILSALRPLV